MNENYGFFGCRICFLNLIWPPSAVCMRVHSILTGGEGKHGVPRIAIIGDKKNNYSSILSPIFIQILRETHVCMLNNMELSKTGYEHSDWRATGWSKSQETAIQLPDAEHYGHDRILKMDMYITTPCLGHGYILIW